MRISDWSSDVCSSDLVKIRVVHVKLALGQGYCLAAKAAHLLQPCDSAGHSLRRHPLHLISGRTLGDIISNDCVQPFGDHVGIDARLHVRCHLYHAELRKILHPRGDMTGKLLVPDRSEEHTSELQSLMRISYAVFCLTKKQQPTPTYRAQT